MRKTALSTAALGAEVSLTEFAALFATWYDLLESFRGLQQAGYGRSDQDLAADRYYHRFLAAGLALHAQGGRPAIRAAADFLCATFQIPELALQRLWAGLLDGGWH